MNEWSMKGSPFFPSAATNSQWIDACWLNFSIGPPAAIATPSPHLPQSVWVPFDITHNNNIFEGVFMGVCRSCCCCCLCCVWCSPPGHWQTQLAKSALGFSMSMFAILWEFCVCGSGVCPVWMRLAQTLHRTLPLFKASFAVENSIHGFVSSLNLLSQFNRNEISNKSNFHWASKFLRSNDGQFKT